MLLLEVVAVLPSPTLAVVAVADPPGPVTEADAETLTPVGVTTTVDDVGEADCALEKEKREHSRSKRETRFCMLIGAVGPRHSLISSSQEVKRVKRSVWTS